MMYLSRCIYFYVTYMLGGDIIFFISVSCFTYMFYEIKNLFCFTCIFHTYVYVFVELFQEYTVDLVVLLSTLAIDR